MHVKEKIQFLFPLDVNLCILRYDTSEGRSEAMFSDGFPFLLANEASLDNLNERKLRREGMVRTGIVQTVCFVF